MAGLADIHWHGVEPFQPDFSPGARTLAFALDGRFTGRELDDDYQLDSDFYVAMNGWIDPVTFVVPRSPTRRPWRRVVDTAAATPADFLAEGTGPLVHEGDRLTLAAHSLVVLVSDP
jgi:glycogen operon protein